MENSAQDCICAGAITRKNLRISLTLMVTRAFLTAPLAIYDYQNEAEIANLKLETG